MFSKKPQPGQIQNEGLGEVGSDILEQAKALLQTKQFF